MTNKGPVRGGRASLGGRPEMAGGSAGVAPREHAGVNPLDGLAVVRIHPAPFRAHHRRCLALAHAWMLVREVCHESEWVCGVPWASVGSYFILRTSCERYQRAVGRYGAGPR